MNLGIKKQLFILTISILIVAVATFATLTIYIIVKQGKSTLEEYRTEEMKKVRTNVKDYVDMAYQSIESNYKSIEDKDYLEKFYGRRLQSIMDIAVAAIEKRAQQALDKKLSLQDAKQMAVKDIEAMRFDNKTGYVWINDTVLPYPKMIMHPTVPTLNGKFLTDAKFNCAMGRNQNLFQAAVEVSVANGQGFVDYIWPKNTPQGVIKDVKKLSYVHYYKDWGWVLGTGIYLDDVKADVVNSILENLKTLKYNNGQGYFWINDTQLPYPRMIMHPTVPTLNGKILDDTTFNCTKGTKQNFFQLMAQKATKDGEGYVEYIWPNPVTNKVESKLSYVRRFQPLDWVIGTGTFIDHIEERIKAREKEINDRVKTVVMIILGISLLLIAGGYIATYYMSTSITKAIFVVRDSLQSLSVGKTIRKLNVGSSNEIGVMNASLNSLVDGINSYSAFAKEIGSGNLDAGFTPLSSEDTLGNSLVQMRENLKKIAKEEEERKWHAEGVTIFNDLIRLHSQDLKELCNHLVSQIAKYLNANQCALYLLEGNKEEAPYLELYSTYAYNRIKHQTKRVNVGEGTIGQAVLEKEHMYLTDVPQDYVKITSGLGEATPTSIIIFPLIYNEEVQGIIEIASFTKFSPFEIEFLKKITETIASSISSSRVTERTKQLLEETRQMAEELRSQEEELRQNNEELQATQEEMNRKLSEAGRRD